MHFASISFKRKLSNKRSKYGIIKFSAKQRKEATKLKKAEILVLTFFLILSCFISVVAFTEPDITLVKTQQH